MSSDEHVSDAAVTAIALAEALPIHRAVSWPPAHVTPEGSRELAAHLRQLGSLGWGYEPAAVALAELADNADPALRVELEAYARNEFFSPAMSFAPGTVGDALKRRVLDGLRVEDHGRSLQIDWLVPHLYDTKGRVLLALRRTEGGEVLRALAEDGVPSRLAFALDLAPDWHVRARVVLREALLTAPAPEDGWCSAAFTARLLEALLPRALDGRAAWLMTRGLELLRPEPEAPVVEAKDGNKTYALHLVDVEHESAFSEYGRVRVRARLVARENTREHTGEGEIVDVAEGEAFEFPLRAEDYAAPAPTDEARARAAVAAWRAAMQEHIVRMLAYHGGGVMIMELLQPTCPLTLIAEWERSGLPGPRPVSAARAAIDPDRLAVAAAHAEWFDDAEVEELRANADRQLLAAIEMDGWFVLFCPWHRVEPGTFEEDRILLAPADGEAVAIAMNDPWNGHVMPIDGDAALFRVVTRFLREVIRRAGLDVAFELPRRDEDEEARRTTLLEWLGFPPPAPDKPRFHGVDWRLYGDDEENDFIADFDFWAHGPFGMSTERRAFYEAAIGSHYHAFIRAVIDPAFPRR